jgi:hypothetical protein
LGDWGIGGGGLETFPVAFEEGGEDGFGFTGGGGGDEEGVTAVQNREDGLLLDGGETAVPGKKERPGMGNPFFDSLRG